MLHRKPFQCGFSCLSVLATTKHWCIAHGGFYSTEDWDWWDEQQVEFLPPILSIAQNCWVSAGVLHKLHQDIEFVSSIDGGQIMTPFEASCQPLIIYLWKSCWQVSKECQGFHEHNLGIAYTDWLKERNQFTENANSNYNYRSLLCCTHIVFCPTYLYDRYTVANRPWINVIQCTGSSYVRFWHFLETFELTAKWWLRKLKGRVERNRKIPIPVILVSSTLCWLLAVFFLKSFPLPMSHATMFSMWTSV